MYNYKVFNWKDVNRDFRITPPSSEYNEQLVIGHIMSGKKSITNSHTSSTTHRYSLIGGVRPEAISHDYRNYLDIVPANATFKMNTDFNVQLNLTVTKTSKVVSDNVNHLNNTCLRTTLHTATLKWDMNSALKVWNAATEFADRVYDNRNNILKKVVNNVINYYDGYEDLEIHMDYVGLRCNKGNTEHKVAFIDEGLKSLNSVQRYGLALALERYLEENNIGYSLNDYIIDFDSICFMITNNKVLSDW